MKKTITHSPGLLLCMFWQVFLLFSCHPQNSSTFPSPDNNRFESFSTDEQALDSSSASVPPVIGVLENLELGANNKFFLVGWTCQLGQEKPLRLHIYSGASAYQKPTGTYLFAGESNLAAGSDIQKKCQTKKLNARFRIEIPDNFLTDSSVVGKKIFVHGLRVIKGTPNSALDNSGKWSFPSRPKILPTPTPYGGKALDALTKSQLLFFRDGLQGHWNTPTMNRCDTAIQLAVTHLEVPGGNVNLANQKIMGLDPKIVFIGSGNAEASPCYWSLMLLLRLHLDQKLQQQLTVDAKKRLAQILKNYLWERSKLSASDGPSSVNGSENHDVHRRVGYLLILQSLFSQGQGNIQLPDGKTVNQHYEKWLKHWKKYFNYRAKYGIDIEIASPYRRVTMAGYTTIRDYTLDPTLRNLAENFLTLSYADWALDHQANTGIRGGPGTRIYRTKHCVRDIDLVSSVPIAFGWNQQRIRIVDPHDLPALLSSYRPPSLVSEIAKNKNKKYLYRSRRLGRGQILPDYEGNYYLSLGGKTGQDTDQLRTLSVTPAYTMGSIFYTPQVTFTQVARQNRLAGVMFATHEQSRIIVVGMTPHNAPLTGPSGLPYLLGSQTGYEDINSISNEDTLIVSRPLAAQVSTETQIYVSNFGNLWDNFSCQQSCNQSDWIFTQSKTPSSPINQIAYVGIRIAKGGFTVKPLEYGKSLLLTDKWSPVVIQLGSAEKYPDLASFISAVKRTNFSYNYKTGEVIYVSPSNQRFNYWRASNSLPSINGVAVNANPPYTFQGPYIKGTPGIAIITLTYPGYTPITLNFNL